MKKELNVDFPESITRLKDLMKDFPLRRDLNKFIFRGKGLDFDGYRKYLQDDDSILIDWKASLRAQDLLVRKYIEERELRIMFVIDVSDSMVFGSTKKLKCEYAAEISASLSNLLFEVNDWIGFFMFSDEVKQYVGPKSGKKQFHIFMNNLKEASNYGGKSHLNKGLNFVLEYFNRAIDYVVLISDFLHSDSETNRIMSFLGGRFKEIIAIQIRDPLDKTLPEIEGEYILQGDLEGQQIILNPKVAKKIYEKKALEKQAMIQEMFIKNGVDYLDLSTDVEFYLPLAIFLKQRMRKFV